MRTPLLALLAIAGTAAAAPTTLGHGQRVGRIMVTPVAVEEDSRCPMNARCVWAGRVVVRAVVTQGHHRTTQRFTLGEPGPAGLMLDSVTPDRVAGGSQRPLRYRFHFASVAPGT